MTGSHSGGREILQKNTCILRNNNPSGGGEQQPLGGARWKLTPIPRVLVLSIPVLVSPEPHSAREEPGCHCRGNWDTHPPPRGTRLHLSDAGLCFRTLPLGQCLKYNWFEVRDLKNVVSEMKPKKGFVLFCSFNENANLKRLTLKKVRDQQKTSH